MREHNEKLDVVETLAKAAQYANQCGSPGIAKELRDAAKYADSSMRDIE